MQEFTELSNFSKNTVLTTFPKANKTLCNLDFIETNELDFSLGISLFLISNKSILQECLDIHKKFPEEDAEELRTIQEFLVDNQYITIVWESPNQNLTYEIEEAIKDITSYCLSLDNFFIQSVETAQKFSGQRIGDCSDLILEDQNSILKDLLLKLYDIKKDLNYDN